MIGESNVKPLIGITGVRYVSPTKASAPGLLGVVSDDDYAHGVQAAGGIPVVIPYLDSDETVTALCDRLDGLLLAGGEDVDPALWGDNPEQWLGQVVPERDDLEQQLIRRMLERQKPILGICRGAQILNVVLGGSLYQDLSHEWHGQIQHSQKARRNHLSHRVRIHPSSQLYQLLGQSSEIRCNSFHHQAVKELGNGLVAVAWDEEGLVEAVEHTTYKWVLAVQWHPENLWRTSSAHHGVFRGLVEAATAASS